MTIAWFLVLPGAASRALSTSACDAPASSGCGGAGAPRCATTLMDTATTPARHKAKRFIWVSLQFDPRSYARIGSGKTPGQVKSVQQNFSTELPVALHRKVTRRLEYVACSAWGHRPLGAVRCRTRAAGNRTDVRCG